MAREANKIPALIEAARGIGKADLVIKNGFVVDVFRNEIVKCNLAIKNGYIVGMGDYRGKKVLDVEGLYVAPGLIDGHTHIESTFLSPQEFGRICLTSGVTALVADPHEIANVLGLPGILWMIEMARHSPVRIFFSCPSCVPSSPHESPGAKISLRDMEKLKKRKEIVALGEMMDFQGLIEGKKGPLRKIALYEGYPLEGHAPGIRGKDLSAYRLSGVASDHETEDPEEAAEKLSKGFHVMVREGSVAKNLESLFPFLHKYQSHNRISIVSDDLNVLDVARGNYLGRVLSKGVKMGVDSLNLLKMVTVNSASRFNLTRMGAIAPGYLADIVFLENLKAFVPRMVMVGGRICYRRGKPLKKASPPFKPDGGGVHLPPHVSPEMLRVKKKGKRLKIIKVTSGQLHNTVVSVSADLMKGEYASSLLSHDLIKICVIERHKGTGRTGRGFVSGLNLKCGAIGLTFAHDAHNLVIAGAGDGEMFEIVNDISRIGGGIIAMSGSGEKALLPLQVGGIISTEPWEKVAARMESVKEVCEKISPLGIDLINILSFIALPVIPEGRITDRGFIDVHASRKVSIWE